MRKTLELARSQLSNYKPASVAVQGKSQQGSTDQAVAKATQGNQQKQQSAA
jgi:hypothetical protein